MSYRAVVLAFVVVCGCGQAASSPADCEPAEAWDGTQCVARPGSAEVDRSGVWQSAAKRVDATGNLVIEISEDASCASLSSDLDETLFVTFPEDLQIGITAVVPSDGTLRYRPAGVVTNEVATSGTITLSVVDAFRVAGTFAAEFPSGTEVQGSFDTLRCDR